MAVPECNYNSYISSCEAGAGSRSCYHFYSKCDDDTNQFCECVGSPGACAEGTSAQNKCTRSSQGLWCPYNGYVADCTDANVGGDSSSSSSSSFSSFSSSSSSSCSDYYSDCVDNGISGEFCKCKGDNSCVIDSWYADNGACVEEPSVCAFEGGILSASKYDSCTEAVDKEMVVLGLKNVFGYFLSFFFLFISLCL